jgi:predicted peptidase
VASATATTGAELKALLDEEAIVNQHVCIQRTYVEPIRADSLMLTETEDSYDTLPFLLFVPTLETTDQGPRPLIVFLHGDGEQGDGGAELSRLKRCGLPRLASRATDARLPSYPFGKRLPPVYEQKGFLLVCPQTSRRRWGEDDADSVCGLVDNFINEKKANASQCYLTGISIGALRAWEVAARKHDRFAALLPVSGWPPRDTTCLPTKTPVWMVLGRADSTIPAKPVEDRLRAFRDGDNTRLTIFRFARHDRTFWDAVYARPEIYSWLLEPSFAHTPGQPIGGVTRTSWQHVPDLNLRSG